MILRTAKAPPIEIRIRPTDLGARLPGKRHSRATHFAGGPNPAARILPVVELISLRVERVRLRALVTSGVPVAPRATGTWPIAEAPVATGRKRRIAPDLRRAPIDPVNPIDRVLRRGIAVARLIQARAAAHEMKASAANPVDRAAQAVPPPVRAPHRGVVLREGGGRAAGAVPEAAAECHAGVAVVVAEAGAAAGANSRNKTSVVCRDRIKGDHLLQRFG